MPPDKPVPRILQQDAQPESDATPQQSGASGDEQKPGAQSGNREMGEGSYEATRDYQKNVKEYLKKADVDADAQAAKPRSDEEARDLDAAEQEGRSHSKGEH